MTPAPARSTHPAPQRARVNLLTLGFGLAAAPLAWSVLILLGEGLTGHACYPGPSSLGSPLFAVKPSLVVAILLAFAVALAAAAVSYGAWQSTRREREGRSQELIEAGEGRTRFIAMCGLLTSGGFFVAMLFVASALILVPSCRG